MNDFLTFYKNGLLFSGAAAFIGAILWELGTALAKKYITKRPYK